MELAEPDAVVTRTFMQQYYPLPPLQPSPSRDTVHLPSFIAFATDTTVVYCVSLSSNATAIRLSTAADLVTAAGGSLCPRGAVAPRSTASHGHFQYNTRYAARAQCRRDPAASARSGRLGRRRRFSKLSGRQQGQQSGPLNARLLITVSSRAIL